MLGSDVQFLKCLFLSLGTLCKVETQSYLALDINYHSQKLLEQKRNKLNNNGVQN